MTAAQPTKDFATRLLSARQEGKSAMQELAEDHLPLVAAMVRRFPHGTREREELYQQGCVGLMKALCRFDPAREISFSTYAAAMILGEMRMLCRVDAPLHIPRQDRATQSRIRRGEQQLRHALGREPTVTELAQLLRIEPAELTLLMEAGTVSSLDAPSRSGTTPLSELTCAPESWMDRLLLRDLVSRLGRQDQRMLLMRLRLGMTQAETARALGISQVQVSRRELAVKAQLRQAWREN